MPIDFSKPVTTDRYDTGVLPQIKASFSALAQWMDPAYAGAVTSPPAGAKRFTGGLIQEFNGSSWVEKATGYLKNTPPVSYTSVSIPGVAGGWAGVQFSDTAKLYSLMVNASDGTSGIYSVSEGRWKWFFDNVGQLIEGTVPWGRVTGAPTITGLAADTNATGNSVVQRNSAGHVIATYLGQVSGNDENPGISQIMVTNGDGYLRKAGIGHLGNSIVVPWGNVSGRPGSMSQFFNDVGFVSWNSAPVFAGLVYGRGGGDGLGRITMTNVAGQPSGGAPGDIVFVY
jgi:hypothetical protein